MSLPRRSSKRFGTLNNQALPSPPIQLTSLMAPEPTAFYIAGSISTVSCLENLHKVLILLDSGATTSAIDRKMVKKYNLPLTTLPYLIQAKNADGTDNSTGHITHAATVTVHIGQISHRWSFCITSLHDANIYLGFDWLYYYNLPIDWKSLTLSIPELEHMRTIHTRPTLPAGIPQDYAEYANVFTQESFNKFPPMRPWDHEIKFVDNAPKSIAAKLYSLTPDKMKSCREFLDENLASGRIVPGKSPITSSFFFTKKADQSLRPVMDYREINKWTILDHYPLPLIDQLIMSLTSVMIFTKLDIRWGFNNI